jgi:ribosomal 30S subunit maturation factor RimM
MKHREIRSAPKVLIVKFKEIPDMNAAEEIKGEYLR